MKSFHTAWILFLCTTFPLFSQQINLSKNSVQLIETFDFEDKNPDLRIATLDGKILVYNSKKDSKIYHSNDVSFDFTLIDNTSAQLHQSVFLMENCMYGLTNKKMTRLCEGISSKINLPSSYTLYRKATLSIDGTVLVLDAGLRGSTIRRLDRNGVELNRSSFNSNEECEATPVYYSSDEPEDRSIYLVGIIMPQANSSAEKKLIVTKVNAELEIIWQTNFDIYKHEVICETSLMSNDNLIIQTVDAKNDCVNANSRVIGINGNGNSIFDICASDTKIHTSILSRHTSLLALKNGFIKYSYEVDNQSNSIFEYYDNKGNFQFKIDVPIQDVTDMKLYGNDILISSKNNLYVIDSEEFIGEINLKNEIVSSIKIFPNPVANSLTIDWGTQSTLHLYSALGVFIETIYLKAGKGKYNFGNLADGVYFISDPLNKDVRRVLKFKKNYEAY